MLRSQAQVFIGASLALAAVFTAANEWLRRHAAEYPKSCLREQNHKGILCMEAWNYVVSVSVQLSLIPIWALAYTTRPENWWYGGHINACGLAFACVLVGYYLQDSFTYWYENSSAILLHHILTVVLITVILAAECWHGLFVTAGLIYEMGSLGMGFVDLGLLERSMGPASMAATTIGGLTVVLSAFEQQSPCDAFAWSAVAMFIFGGLARLHMARSYLSEADQCEGDTLLTKSAKRYDESY